VNHERGQNSSGKETKEGEEEKALERGDWAKAKNCFRSKTTWGKVTSRGKEFVCPLILRKRQNLDSKQKTRGTAQVPDWPAAQR